MMTLPMLKRIPRWTSILTEVRRIALNPIRIRITNPTTTMKRQMISSHEAHCHLYAVRRMRQMRCLPRTSSLMLMPNPKMSRQIQKKKQKISRLIPLRSMPRLPKNPILLYTVFRRSSLWLKIRLSERATLYAMKETNSDSKRFLRALRYV